MTIACAWVREFGQSRELVFASDSRLRWAGAWDSCPKLFRLPRTDAAMAFAGDTLWAYPIVAQTANNIATHRPALERRLDLLETKGHTLRVINDMIVHGDAVSGPDPPDAGARFLFGGFSADEGDFRIWKFVYRAPLGRYVAERVKRKRIGQFAFIGDVAKEAARRLYARTGEGHQSLSMEPLDVIVDLLREGNHESVGGPPQLIKVYRHMQSAAFVVPWREQGDQDSRRTLLGRRLLDYEASDAPVVDLDAPFGPPG